MASNARTLELSDPVYHPKTELNSFERFAMRYINDPRDIPFVRLILLLSCTVVPLGLYLFIPGAFNWWLAALYLALSLGVFLGPYILMLHNTSHRTLFRPKYKWMRHYIPNVLGPFFGETPASYYVHHIGMHHPENNLPDDLSSTMRFQRDSVIDYFRYLGRFMVVGSTELAFYLWRRRRFKLFRQLMFGEYGYWIALIVMLFVAPLPTLVVFAIPLVAARFGMMSGNWAQHAFIDASDPANCYRNSITCINCTYNRRCFNDGYHIGHHVKANRHWTDMPTDFLKNVETYQREGAIVFEGVDFFVIWFLLMTKNYRALARHYVHLGPERPSEQEIIDLLKTRVRRIDIARYRATQSVPAMAN